MKTLKIIKTFANIDELRNSEYPFKYADNFGYTHLIKSELSRWEKYTPTIYICEADPINEYGLDFTIQLCYMADGIQFLKKWSHSSSLTSGGLRQVIIDNNTITFGDTYYDKSASSRSGLRKMSNDHGWIFN